jgi:uncharacterized protein YhfF
MEPSTPLPLVVNPFGDRADLADELIALVVHGPKRATAGALADFERDAVDLPVVGSPSAAYDDIRSAASTASCNVFSMRSTKAPTSTSSVLFCPCRYRAYTPCTMHTVFQWLKQR